MTFTSQNSRNLGLALLTLALVYGLYTLRLHPNYNIFREPQSEPSDLLIESLPLSKPQAELSCIPPGSSHSTDHVEIAPTTTEWFQGSPASEQNAAPKPLKIAITESMGNHAEIWAALLYAFGRQPNTEVQLFLHEPRFNMQELVKSFELTSPLHDYVSHDIHGIDVYEPDILISTTCETDVEVLAPRFDTWIQSGRTYLLCLSHAADFQWEEAHTESGLSEWIEKDMVTLLTLAPHVADAFKRPDMALWKWKVFNSGHRSSKSHSTEESDDNRGARTKVPSSPPIEVLVPVFPPPISRNGHKDNKDVGFAVQGYLNRGVRNYTRSLEQFEHLLQSNDLSQNKRSPSLHFIGAGNLKIPKALQDNVFLHNQDLEYIEYYNTLSHMEAIMPSFADDMASMYFTEKASSSIAASIIAEVPLIANPKLMRTYSYLDEDAVYMMSDDETEQDVMERVLQLGKREIRKKREGMRAMRDRLLEENDKLAERLIEVAKRRIGR